jgi:hypothetical protein
MHHGTTRQAYPMIAHFSLGGALSPTSQWRPPVERMALGLATHLAALARLPVQCLPPSIIEAVMVNAPGAGGGGLPRSWLGGWRADLLRSVDGRKRRGGRKRGGRSSSSAALPPSSLPRPPLPPP